jgi:cyclopropane fatty-acyl-phospholipid synthase-like methyltransferase
VLLLILLFFDMNQYYDLATEFYEYGWGQSFHFATKYKGESFEASIARHEYWLASRIGIKKGDTVLDVGCGVGGPLRNIARFTGAKVIGLNNNESVTAYEGWTERECDVWLDVLLMDSVSLISHPLGTRFAARTS